ncbi:MAG TPA: hypothetical protein EYP10_07030 [Armatimonadetes bacterium]|nr:hypothetical protein [Armatimonadota bacterium]
MNPNMRVAGCIALLICLVLLLIGAQQSERNAGVQRSNSTIKELHRQIASSILKHTPRTMQALLIVRSRERLSKSPFVLLFHIAFRRPDAFHMVLIRSIGRAHLFGGRDGLTITRLREKLSIWNPMTRQLIRSTVNENSSACAGADVFEDLSGSAVMHDISSHIAAASLLPEWFWRYAHFGEDENDNLIHLRAIMPRLAKVVEPHAIREIDAWFAHGASYPTKMIARDASGKIVTLISCNKFHKFSDGTQLPLTEQVVVKSGFVEAVVENATVRKNADEITADIIGSVHIPSRKILRCYQVRDKYWLPKSVEIRDGTTGKLEMEFRFTNISINIDMPDAYFQAPIE